MSAETWDIEFDGLMKRFGDRTVLNGISFRVARGEIIFILGTSGTGKSVLLKTLTGLLRADGGRVVVQGQDLTHLSEEAYLDVRRKCGMVFQHPALFDSLSIEENVAFGLQRHLGLSLEAARPRVRECLQLVQLDYDELAELLPAQISYGMQKRVSLARTLAVQPQILLFDEPTTGLDPVTTKQINRLILELSRKLQTTSMVVSHDMDCALEIADRIIVLDQGRIIEQGRVEEVKRSQVPLVREFLAEALAGHAESASGANTRGGPP